MALRLFSTVKRTASSRHKPAPAISVSWTCDSTVSVSSSTPATPPCAQYVEPLERSPLLSTAIRKWLGRVSAVVKPAAPLPMINTSYCAYWLIMRIRFKSEMKGLASIGLDCLAKYLQMRGTLIGKGGSIVAYFIKQRV